MPLPVRPEVQAMLRKGSNMNRPPAEIQLHRVKGWRLPPGAVSVARPTKWGNPYRVGVEVETAEEAVLAYARDLIDAATCRLSAGSVAVWRANHPMGPAGPFYVILHACSQLRGRDLACFCRIGTPCHRSVLLELANRPADGLLAVLIRNRRLPRSAVHPKAING